jgi:hypothetical protein
MRATVSLYTAGYADAVVTPVFTWLVLSLIDFLRQNCDPIKIG